MPPCSCVACWPMNFAERPICALAAEIAWRARFGVGLARHHRRELHHAARLLERHHHVGGAVLQGLERADRHAELFARLQIFGRDLDRLAHRADGLGAKRRDRLVERRLQRGRGAFGIAEHVLGPDAHVGEAHLRRALTVLRRIAAPRHAFGVRHRPRTGRGPPCRAGRPRCAPARPVSGRCRRG